VSETKHTPTPWRSSAEVTQEKNPRRFESAVTTDSGTILNIPVASCAFPGLLRQEECEANAAFIVRAVNCHDEMADALAASKSAIEGLLRILAVDFSTFSPTEGPFWKAVSKCNAALAKAEAKS
jgi:hypothetical protein